MKKLLNESHGTYVTSGPAAQPPLPNLNQQKPLTDSNQMIGELYSRTRMLEDEISEYKQKLFDLHLVKLRRDDEIRVLKKFLENQKLLDVYEDTEFYLNNSDPELY